jgi:hypothetical protein
MAAAHVQSTGTFASTATTTLAKAFTANVSVNFTQSTGNFMPQGV